MGQHVDTSSMLNTEVVFKAMFSIMALTSTEGDVWEVERGK